MAVSFSWLVDSAENETSLVDGGSAEHAQATKTVSLHRIHVRNPEIWNNLPDILFHCEPLAGRRK